jgi:hypothetical protein
MKRKWNWSFWVGLVVAVAGMFSYEFFAQFPENAGFSMPASTGAPRVGQKAPHFTLPDQNGKSVALADLLSNNSGALLIFYRGHW